MILTFQNSGLFLWGFNHKLGRVSRLLPELHEAKLLANDVETLTKIGYRQNFGLGEDESLLSLASAPMASTLRLCPSPHGLVFQHCYAESAVVPWAEGDPDVMARTRYFPAALMKEFAVDHLPYFCSFGSGCAGFIFLLTAAGGLLASCADGSVVCLTADIRPRGVSYDALRERILSSDCSSGFIISRERRGYQLLGTHHYSTTRTLVPLVEIVKRTVQMIRDLAQSLQIEVTPNTVVHYPNIFPGAWSMVTQYLKIPPDQHIMDAMLERGHCLSSDSVISLAKTHCGQEGRLHIVVNYGSGLHLGVCILREQAAYGPTN